MASGSFFAGSFSRRPRVVAQIDDSALTPFQIGAPETVAILGIGLGGEPGVPKLYNDPTEAARDLRGGELLTAVRYAFNPSPASRGAALVYAVRINPATQASASVKDGSGNETIVLTSRNYGVEDNVAKYKIGAASVKGAKISLGKNSELYVKDNVWRDSFSLVYVGDASTATVTINGTTITVATAGAVDDLSIDLASYKTVQDVVGRFNTTGKYVAAVLDTNPDRGSLAGFDFVTASSIALADHQTYSLPVGTATVDIVVDGWAQDWTIQVAAGVPALDVAMTAVKTGHAILVTLGTNGAGALDASKNTATLIEAAIEAVSGVSSSITGSGAEIRGTILGVTPFVSGDLNELTLQANVQAMIDWINSGGNPLVGATRGASGKEAAVVDWSYLSGAVEGSTAAQDWLDALVELETLDVAHVVIVSPTAAYYAYADDHCQRMSSDGRRPRRAWLGLDLDANVQDGVDAAQALNSSRSILAVQGVGGYDVNGAATFQPPYIAAAMYAGLQAGVAEIGDSITHQSIRATGIEWTASGADQELLIEGGCLVVEHAQNRGFFRVVRGITTWLQNDAFDKVEISTGIALDEVVRAVVDGLDIFLGQKGSPLLVHRIASRTESILMGEQAAGTIVGDAPGGKSPAFRQIVVTLSGDTAKVSFECSPAIPLNFINVSIFATPFTGEITVAIG